MRSPAGQHGAHASAQTPLLCLVPLSTKAPNQRALPILHCGYKQCINKMQTLVSEVGFLQNFPLEKQQDFLKDTDCDSNPNSYTSRKKSMLSASWNKSQEGGKTELNPTVNMCIGHM